MGCHASRSFCSSDPDAAAGTAATARPFTYTGVPLDALVAYERAALHLSHDLDHLRHSNAMATAAALARASASQPTSGNCPRPAPQPPQRPLLHASVDAQRYLQWQHEQQQHHRHTNKDSEVVAVEAVYQAGVPVLLQELAWEWGSSAARECHGHASDAGRQLVLRAKQMAVWRARTAELLHKYVTSRRYEKALRHARKAAQTSARPRAPAAAAAAAPQYGGISNDSGHYVPQPCVFRELFKSYAVLAHSLTTSPRVTATASARSSHAPKSTSTVTPSMWCAVLCWFVRALPEPLMPLLCSRRLEPLAGAPPRSPVAAKASTPTTQTTYTAACRVVEESFASTDVVAYTTFCYILHLVQEHRTELTGEEVEAVAQAVVREPSLAQTTREVARACKPDMHIFGPPRTSVGTSSRVTAAAMAREKGPGETGRGRSSLTADTSPSTLVPTFLQVSACAAALEKSKTPAGGTAKEVMASGQRSDAMASSSDVGDRSEPEGVAAGVEATEVQGQLAEPKAAIHASASVAVKAATPSTTPAVASGEMRRQTTSSSSTTVSEEDGSVSKRCPEAVAAHAIPAAAQPTGIIRHASPVPQKGSLAAAVTTESHPQPHLKERLITSSEEPLLRGTSLICESKTPLASEHCYDVAQRSVKRRATLSEDEDMQVQSVLASRPELTAFTVSKLNSDLCPSVLEDPGAVEAEAEDLRRALQPFSEPPLTAITNARNDEDGGGGPHPRPPKGESGSPQNPDIDCATTSLAPVPLPSLPHHITPTSTSPRDEQRHQMPEFGGAETPTPATALLFLPWAQESAAPLPASAFRAQAEQPLLTALMIAKQRFLVALRVTPKKESTAGSEDCSSSVVDHRLERVMACAREMGWASSEGLIESLRSAHGHLHDKTSTVPGTEAAALSSARASALTPNALGSSGDRCDPSDLPQSLAEAPRQAQKFAAVCVPISGLMGSSDVFSSVDASMAENRVGYGRESQQPHGPHQVAVVENTFLSTQTESADSAVRVETTREFCSSGAARTNLQNGPLPSPSATEDVRRCSNLTTPLTMMTMSASATADAAVAAAQPLSGVEQELKKLRCLVHTLESQQFVQSQQSSAQTSELRARCAELQHQQLEQEKHLRLARARLLEVGKELDNLRDAKTHLQMQLAASREEGTRLRDALLMDEART
ncbi:hypothetical protein LPMP_250870 [Leishmania panamensis]|uniref:Uncharacterized protein n=1 Tax=Leishmania panamensis TaxID=5679 RepID=A0A088RSR0_LEIPA|nr:hypothetical protein LPMP_250870 [Leishmania panamensis]AIN98950.1 hypothetical protein LPMP_250870 [Leishmania panamensis]